MKIILSNSNLIFNKIINLLPIEDRLDANTSSILEMSDTNFNSYHWVEFWQDSDSVTTIKNNNYFRVQCDYVGDESNHGIRLKLRDELKIQNVKISFEARSVSGVTEGQFYFSEKIDALNSTILNTNFKKYTFENIDLSNSSRIQFGIYAQYGGIFDIKNISISK